MKYLIKCLNCPATALARGDYDPDTNGFELLEDPEWRLRPGDLPAGGAVSTQSVMANCGHQEFEVVDEEDDSDVDYWEDR